MSKHHSTVAHCRAAPYCCRIRCRDMLHARACTLPTASPPGWLLLLCRRLLLLTRRPVPQPRHSPWQSLHGPGAHSPHL